jgi:glycosyltransferase involved in cell wall biosynthesis
MRLLYVIDSLVPGGAEQSLAALAPRYRDRGIELEVAYLHDRPGLQDALTDAGARLFCLSGRGGRAGWAARATRLARTRRPDLIHTTIFEADVAGRVAASFGRIPVVSSLVNVEYGPEQFDDPRLKTWRLRGAQFLDALTARRVSRFHAITHHVAEVMAARLRIPRDRIVVVPRGRDPERLGSRTASRRAAARTSLGVGADTPLIVAAARHEYQKGLDVLVTAMPDILRAVPKTRLVVAGRTGNQTAELKRLVGNLGLEGSVQLLGVRSDVPDLLSAADAFVLPSRWEGLGSVLLEAMALEAPIVASSLPPVCEIVGEQHARLVPPGRADVLAEELSATLLDRAGSESRAKAARDRFLDEFAIDTVADRMITFYDDAMRIAPAGLRQAG